MKLSDLLAYVGGLMKPKRLNRSKYKPHQGEQEKARRRKQIERGTILCQQKSK